MSPQHCSPLHSVHASQTSNRFIFATAQFCSEGLNQKEREKKKNQNIELIGFRAYSTFLPLIPLFSVALINDEPICKPAPESSGCVQEELRTWDSINILFKRQLQEGYARYA